MNTQASPRWTTRKQAASAASGCVDYRRLRNPFADESLSDDAIAAMHDAALTTLRIWVKILLAEARQMFRAGGARVDDASEMVWIGREMVSGAGNRAALDPVPRRRPEGMCFSSREASCSSLAPARPMPRSGTGTSPGNGPRFSRAGK